MEDRILRLYEREKGLDIKRNGVYWDDVYKQEQRKLLNMATL